MNPTLKFKLFVFYPVHILSIIGLFVMDVSIVNMLMLLVGWVLIHGLGAEVTIHRYLSHRAFKFKPYLRIPSFILATLSIQGGIVGWAAVHRNSHHRHSDTMLDAHSPVRGIYTSWHGWIKDWDKFVDFRSVRDLLKDRQLIYIMKNAIPIIYVIYLIAGLISIDLLYWGLMLPATISIIQVYNTNLFCHLDKFGYRNYNVKDRSRNILWLGYTTWGLGWHNNHHYRPVSLYTGSTISGKWYEFDPAMLIIPLVKQ